MSRHETHSEQIDPGTACAGPAPASGGEHGVTAAAVPKFPQVMPTKRALTDVCDMFDTGKIVVPDWHRDYIWTASAASLLVESILLGLPTPIVYTARRPDDVQEVIDGHQRLVSLRSFARGVLRLRDLRVRPEVNGCTIRDLSAMDRFAFLGHGLELAMLRNPSHEVKVMYFDRLNRHRWEQALMH